MNFAVCNETFEGWDWTRTCRRVAEIGYDGIELAPFTVTPDVRLLSSADRARLRRDAEQAGLQVVGLHWLLVAPKGLSVTDPDQALRRETSDYLVALADLCADLGGSVMVFGSPAQRRIPEGTPYDAAVARYVESLRPALDRAGERGVRICIEPLPQPEANFILTLAEAKSIIETLDHPAAASILDVKSASSEGVPIPELISRYGDIIAHVHANDANRRGPGFGETDFRPILTALGKVGYDGFVSVEVFDYSPDPETIAVNSLEYLRRCSA